MIVRDDFNRDASATLGDNWTQRTGTCVILPGAYANTVDCRSNGLATYNRVTSNTIALDVFHDQAGAQTDYVALVLGYANNANNLFIEVQDQDASAGFERIFFYFYFGNNGSSNSQWLPAVDRVELFGAQITSARFVVSLNGTDLFAGFDTNFDGTYEYSRVKGGVPLGLLGTGIGIGGSSRQSGTLGRDAYIDNFSVPEPASLALLGVGLVGLAAARRRKG